MSNNIQFRGHCPCCGNEQAVLKGGKGGMSKHGYTVDFGYFHGVCQGNGSKPMEVSKDKTLKVVEEVKADIIDLKDKIEGLKNGTLIVPRWETGRFNYVNDDFGRRVRKPVMIEWEQADEYQRKRQVKWEIHHIESRIRDGEFFIEHLLNVLERVHGKDLIEIDKTPKKVEYVQVGEVRRLDNEKGSLVKVVDKIGRRIYWIAVESGRKGWTGDIAFKKLEKVEGV